ncbi:MAG: hypothetical protein HXY19_05545 [Thermoanaerobaculaceae bacterium]|nr:hypothetical protein [Thermoanaerobaculaceae bacterium]
MLACDAHHSRHLPFDRVALAIAAKASVPEAAIVNFLPGEAMVRSV